MIDLKYEEESVEEDEEDMVINIPNFKLPSVKDEAKSKGSYSNLKMLKNMSI